MEANFHSSAVGAGGAGMEANFFSGSGGSEMASTMRAGSIFSTFGGIGMAGLGRGFVGCFIATEVGCARLAGFDWPVLAVCLISWTGATTRLTCKGSVAVDERGCGGALTFDSVNSPACNTSDNARATRILIRTLGM